MKKLARPLVYLKRFQVVHLSSEGLVQHDALAWEDFNHVLRVGDGRVSSNIAIFAIVCRLCPWQFLRTTNRQPLPTPNREGPDTPTHPRCFFGPLCCIIQLQTTIDDQMTQFKAAHTYVWYVSNISIIFYCSMLLYYPFWMFYMHYYAILYHSGD